MKNVGRGTKVVVTALLPSEEEIVFCRVGPVDARPSSSYHSLRLKPMLVNLTVPLTVVRYSN